MKRKIMIVLCLAAMLAGLLTIPVWAAQGADTGFRAGYGMGDITPAYTVTEIPVSSTAANAASGVNDLGTVSLKVVPDLLVFGSYGTSEARMGQDYVGSNSYDAAGQKISKKSYFTYQNGEAVTYQWVDSDMYATCITLQNGSEAPLLLMSLDLPGVSEALTAQLRSRICDYVKEQAGVELDPDRIMFSSSHTHSAPDTDAGKNPDWLENIFFPGALEAALESVQDLAQAEMQVGTVTSNEESHNYTGSNLHEELQYMSAVRHYKYLIYECTACGGSYANDNYADGYKELVVCPVCDQENTRQLVTRYYGDSFYTRAEGIAAPSYMQMSAEEAYQDMHLVQFARSSKQDIVLINWRVHPHRTGGEDNSVFSSDLVGGLRDALSGVRGEDGTYTGITDSEKPYLVAYYQGAAGNINETSHDRAYNGSNNSFGATVPSGTQNSDYTANYYGDSQSEHYTADYYEQGYVLAQIARFGLEQCMDTDVTEGTIQTIHADFTSDGAELSIQIAQLREAGYTQEEHALYTLLYDTVVTMRAIWADRYDTTKYADIQACRKAVIAADPTHTLNGIYQANKMYSILHPYVNNGVFDETSYNAYMSDARYDSEEINAIVIGEDVAIVTAPHELFDNTSVRIESNQETLGLKKIMTFGYANGANGYLPNREAWLYEAVDANGNPVTYSSYEANVCNYKIGTAEAMAGSLEAMLADLTAQETTEGHGNHCACQGSTDFYHNTGHECNWEAWEPVPASGGKLSMENGKKYYLTEDVTLDSVQVANITDEIPNVKAMLCLNGYTLTVKDASVNLSVGESLAICDCSTDQTGVLQNSSSTGRLMVVADGGSLLLYGGTLSGSSKHQVLLNKGSVYMFGGSIADGKTTVSAYSGNITMTAGEFWQYGGTVENGQASCKPWTQDTVDNKENIHGAGGNLFLSGGVYNQYAGEIKNGKAALSGGNIAMTGGSFFQYGGSITGGTALPTEAGFSKNMAGAGGNVYIGGGKFSQYAAVEGGQAASYGGNVYVTGTDYYMYAGATVSGGQATGDAIGVPETTAALDASFAHEQASRGGNIAANAGLLWLYDGTVSKGQAATGGNIYAYGSTARIGGTVTGGSASEQGNNVYFESASRVLNLGGCSITEPLGTAQENVYVASAGTVKLIDNCQITGGDYAVLVRNTPASGTNGVWLDHAPVFDGTAADIALDSNSMLSVYGTFDYASYNAEQDSRITVSSVDNTVSLKFARKANSSIQLNYIQDCFVGSQGESYSEGTIKKVVQSTSDISQQWLVLTLYTAALDGGTEKTHTLQGAIDHVAANGGTVTLLQDVDMGDTALVYETAGTLLMDLNGYDLTAEFTLSSDAKLACVDTSLVSYEDSDAHGRLYTNSQVEPQIQHSDGTKTRRFLRLTEDANADGVPGYSFHRVYMNISSVSVNPGSGDISASAVFLADRQVAQALDQDENGYGFSAALVLDGETVMEPAFIPVDDRLQAGPYEDLSDLKPYTVKQKLIRNILGSQSYTVDQCANMQIIITPALMLDGQLIYPGNRAEFTFKSMVQRMNASWDTASSYLQNALVKMYGTYQDTMSAWDDAIIDRIRTAYEQNQ